MNGQRLERERGRALRFCILFMFFDLNDVSRDRNVKKKHYIFR